MTYVFLTLALVAFIFAFDRLRIVPTVTNFLARTRRVLNVVRSPRIADDRKERAVQRAAIRLSAGSIDIMARSVFSLLPALACVAAGAAAGLYSAEDALAVGADPYFLVFLTALAAVQMKMVRNARAVR